MKRKIATSAAACGICLGVVAPLAVSPAFADPIWTGPSSVAADREVTAAGTDVLGGYVTGADENTVVVIVPGTDDTLSPRIDGLVAGRQSIIVSYPESFWPIISGKSGQLLPFLAPTYDDSRSVGTENTLTVMRVFHENGRTNVVYTGYSQGSDALGNAAEKGWAEGLIGSETTVLLVSDPRGPWGIKSKLNQVPFASPLLGAIGVTNDGARDPGATGDVKVVHVIIQGDPVGHTQWDPMRPLSSIAVNAAGFLAIHSGTGPYTYAHLENLKHVKTMTSEDGSSTYEIYDTYHPFALLNAMIYDAVGMPYDEDDLDEWDRAAEAFYPTQEITAGTADPSVKVNDAPLSSVADAPLLAVSDSSTPSYEPKHALVGEVAPLEMGKHAKRSRHAAPEPPTVVPSAPAEDAGDAGVTGGDTAPTSNPGVADAGEPDGGDLGTGGAGDTGSAGDAGGTGDAGSIDDADEAPTAIVAPAPAAGDPVDTAA